METKKQSVAGFSIKKYETKKAKDTEKLTIVLEADVDNIKTGTFDMGDFQKALLNHMTGETEVGLSLFMETEDV